MQMTLERMQEILNCPFEDEDTEAVTVGHYFVLLLGKLWTHEEGFSGKRPFGNSGWKGSVMYALEQHGIQTNEQEVLDVILNM